jgi:hypothetical protein
MKLLTILFVVAALAACGGENANESGNSSNVTAVSEIDYGFSVNCPKYFLASNSPNWHGYYYDYANRLNINIVSNVGRKIEEVAAVNPGVGGIVFEGTQTKQIIQKYLGTENTLQFQCIHNFGDSKTQVFSYNHNLADKSIWKVTNANTNTNSVHFNVSMLADLETNMVSSLIAKRGTTLADAKQISSSRLQTDFPSNKYGLILDNNLRSDGLGTFGLALNAEDTPNGRTYRRFKQLAELFTSVAVGDIQGLNVFLGNEFESFYSRGVFSRPEVSGAVFSALATLRTLSASDFSSAEWRESKNVPAEIFNSQSRVNIDKSWTASFEWIRSGTTDDVSIAKSQDIQVTKLNTFDKTFFTYELDNAIGGCRPGIFSCVLSSGIAGSYVCFISLSNQIIGCVVFSAITDLITINNFVGRSFDGNNPLNQAPIKFIRLSADAFGEQPFGLERSTSLKTIISMSNNATLQSAWNEGKISTISIGAIVLASSGKCYECRASVTIRKLGITSLP